MILVQVRYRLKPGVRQAYLEALTAAGIANATRKEPGNVQYEYFCPVDAPDELLLLECWADEAALQTHLANPLPALLSLKQEYVLETAPQQYRTAP